MIIHDIDMYEDILMIIGIVLIVVIWSLKLVHLLLKVVITLAAIALILNFFGYLAPLNQPINRMITVDPAVSCAYDSDCTLKPILCDPCDCGSAVNKEWDRFCMLKDTRVNTQCAPCPQQGTDYTIQCVVNTCKSVPKQ